MHPKRLMSLLKSFGLTNNVCLQNASSPKHIGELATNEQGFVSGWDLTFRLPVTTVH